VNRGEFANFFLDFELFRLEMSKNLLFQRLKDFYLSLYCLQFSPEWKSEGDHYFRWVIFAFDNLLLAGVA
jgi:hypothetical protein